MQIAICGAGVAGPTLAYFLARDGHRVTLVERANALRRGGYVIDFWGFGYSIAEKMGILPRVRERGYQIDAVRFVDGRGRKVGGFDADTFRQATGDRFTSLPRGELAAAIFDAAAPQIETVFGDSVGSITQHADRVTVGFTNGGPRDFDLLIGAGGLHSPVRNLCFGPQERYEVDLGYHVAALEIEGYAPRDELTYVSHAEPGRQLARFSLRHDRTMFLFVFRNELMASLAADTAPRDVLRSVFGDMRWECPDVLSHLDESAALYFDRVSQIRMPKWSKGRVMLVGDAASCVSLLAGEGTGLAMIEAYVLAGELKRADGDHKLAFARHEQLLRPFIAAKQKSAASFAGAFAPRTELGIWFRNQVTKLFAVPPVADYFIARDLKDRLALPDYDSEGAYLPA